MSLSEQIKQLIAQSGVAGDDLKQTLRDVVAENWPDALTPTIIEGQEKPSSVIVAQERQGPTRSFKDKVKTLDELKVLMAQWRAEGDNHVGITSGVFDIVHPGHISFLEDCKQHSKHLIVIIASDRTVRAQKGTDKPFVSELKRAQTIAALNNVDAVIISDELYHETILQALNPNILFKGDDYKGKIIMGAELVDQVVLIPCAEKDFYSSSAFATRIRNTPPDTTRSGGV